MDNRIKTLRKRSGFTQAQIGDYLNVDQSMIAKIENGERNLSTVQLNKLANLFACSEDYVLGYDTSEIPKELAFRIKDHSIETMQVIASVNRIAANMDLLNKLLEAEDA